MVDNLFIISFNYYFCFLLIKTENKNNEINNDFFVKKTKKSQKVGYSMIKPPAGFFTKEVHFDLEVDLGDEFLRRNEQRRIEGELENF